MLPLNHKRARFRGGWMCLLLVGGLFCSPSATAGGPEGMPIYGRAKSHPFSGRLQTNKVPMDVMVFETADSMEQVLSYYRKEIESRGKQVITHAFSSSLVYIGYYDIKSESMHLATVMSQPGGTTWIILSNMDPRQLKQPMVAPAWVPSLEGASDVVVTDDVGGEGLGTTVSFRMHGRPIDEVRNEFIEKAGRQGWQREEKVSFGEGEVLSFRQGDRRYLVQFLVVDELDKEILVSMIVFGKDSEPAEQKKGGGDDKD